MGTRNFQFVRLRDSALADPQVDQFMDQSKNPRRYVVLTIDKNDWREIVCNSEALKLIDRERTPNVITNNAATHNQHASGFRVRA